MLRNCFWKSEIKTVQDGTTLKKVNAYTVRIPSDESCEKFTVSSGDIVVLGICEDMITMKSPNTAAEVLNRNKPNAFSVTAYADNTSHIMNKHYRLGG